MFRNLVSRNNNRLSDLIDRLKSEKNEFESCLKNHKNEVDKIYKLEEFEKDKKEMEIYINQFRNLYKDNYYMRSSSNNFKDSYRSGKSFNSSRSIKEYKSDIDYFFRNCKNDNIKIIKTDADNCINDIKIILNLFTTGIQKFEENKDLFEERIEDIKNYSQELWTIHIMMFMSHQ